MLGILVVGLIALGLQGLFGNADLADLKESGQPAASVSDRRDSKTEGTEISLAVKKRAPAGKTPADQTATSLSPELSGHIPGETVRQNGVDDAEARTGNALQAPRTLNVVGRPFPLSDSIKESCRQQIAENPDAVCQEVRPVVRDVSGATR